MLKIVLLLSTLFSVLIAFTGASETGIKFTFDTKLLNLVKQIDFSKKFSNTTLIGSEGISFIRESFPSVTLKANNLILSKLENPESIEVETNMENRNLKLHLKNMKLSLQVTYDFKLISTFKDSGNNTNIDIVLDEFVLSIKFTESKISIDQLNFKFAKIDFSLNEVILNFILKIFRNTLISKLNKSNEFMRVSMEKKLNKLISTEKLIDLQGMGIGVNATFTEKPNMELKDKITFERIEENSNPLMRIFVDLVQEILESEKGKIN